jgi:hypothetical protein
METVERAVALVGLGAQCESIFVAGWAAHEILSRPKYVELPQDDAARVVEA